MQFALMIKSLALAIIAFSTVVLSASVDKSTYLANLGLSEVPKYNLSKAVWKGNHNGKYYELEGHIMEIIDQLEVLDPGSTAAIHAAAANLTTPGLTPRSKSNTLCIPVPGQGWGYASWDAVDRGYRYLNSLPGCSWVAARHCALLACFQRDNSPKGDPTGIFQCNDRDDDICPTTAYLGSYANDINNRCHHAVDLSGGQEFDTDNYNVIAKYECIGL